MRPLGTRAGKERTENETSRYQGRERSDIKANPELPQNFRCVARPETHFLKESADGLGLKMET